MLQVPLKSMEALTQKPELKSNYGLLLNVGRQDPEPVLPSPQVLD